MPGTAASPPLGKDGRTFADTLASAMMDTPTSFAGASAAQTGEGPAGGTQEGANEQERSDADSTAVAQWEAAAAEAAKFLAEVRVTFNSAFARFVRACARVCVFMSFRLPVSQSVTN